MPFAPAGLITLTTDFGTKDPFAGSVHLAVVDPGVGTARGVVLAHAGSHVLLAPDNGLLPEALRDDPDVEWRVMDPDLPARLELGPSSPTFHGRDLFGPLAAALASGALPPADFGRPAPPEDPAPLPRALQDAAGVVGQVVLADHFGNLFTSIHAAQVAGCRQPTVEAAGRAWPLLATYGEASAGMPLALVNAFGLLELALNGASAAALPGLGEGAVVRLQDGLRT